MERARAKLRAVWSFGSSSKSIGRNGTAARSPPSTPTRPTRAPVLEGPPSEERASQYPSDPDVANVGTRIRSDTYGDREDSDGVLDTHDGHHHKHHRKRHHKHHRDHHGGHEEHKSGYHEPDYERESHRHREHHSNERYGNDSGSPSPKPKTKRGVSMQKLLGALKVATSPRSASKSPRKDASPRSRVQERFTAEKAAEDRAKGHLAEDAAAARTDALAEFREVQRNDHAALDDRLRRDRLNEMRELDILTSREGVIQEGQMNELAELRELHERMIQAIHSCFDLKRELAGCQRQGPADTHDNVVARLDQAEAEAVAAEASQHELIEPLVRGDGATIDQEVARLTGMLEQQTKELEGIMAADANRRVAVAKKRAKRLRERLEQKASGGDAATDSRSEPNLDSAVPHTTMTTANASDASARPSLASLEQVLARDIAELELKVTCTARYILAKNRIRMTFAYGVDTDVAQELQWYELRQGWEKDLLAKYLDAERQRRQAVLREVVTKERAQRTALLERKGFGKESDYTKDALQRIAQHFEERQAAVEGQFTEEAAMYMTEFDARLGEETEQHKLVLEGILALQQRYAASWMTIRRNIEKTHLQKEEALRDELHHERFDRANELARKMASVHEIKAVLVELNEQDLRRVRGVQIVTQLSLTASLMASLADHRLEIEAHEREEEMLIKSQLKASPQELASAVASAFAHKLDLEDHDAQTLEFAMGRVRAHIDELRGRRLAEIKSKRAVAKAKAGGDGDEESEGEGEGEGEGGDESESDEELEELEYELAAQEERELDQLELESAKAANKLWAEYVASSSAALADIRARSKSATEALRREMSYSSQSGLGSAGGADGGGRGADGDGISRQVTEIRKRDQDYHHQRMVQLRNERAAAAEADAVVAEAARVAAERELSEQRRFHEEEGRAQAQSLSERHAAERAKLEQSLQSARAKREGSERKRRISDQRSGRGGSKADEAYGSVHPLVAAKLHSALAEEKTSRLGLEIKLAGEVAQSSVARQHGAGWAIAVAHMKLRQATDDAWACKNHARVLRGEAEAEASKAEHAAAPLNESVGGAAGEASAGADAPASAPGTEVGRVARVRQRKLESKERSEAHRRRTVTRVGSDIAITAAVEKHTHQALDREEHALHTLHEAHADTIHELADMHFTTPPEGMRSPDKATVLRGRARTEMIDASVRALRLEAARIGKEGIEKVRVDRDVLRKELIELKKQVAAGRIHLEKTRSDLETHKEVVDWHKRELTTVGERAKAAEQARGDKHEEARTMALKLERYRRERRTAISEWDESRRECEGLKANLEVARAELQEAVDARAPVVQQLRESEAKVAEEKAAHAETKAELERTKQKFDKAMQPVTIDVLGLVSNVEAEGGAVKSPVKTLPNESNVALEARLTRALAELEDLRHAFTSKSPGDPGMQAADPAYLEEVARLRARAAEADQLEVDLKASHDSNKRMWDMMM